MYELFKLEIVIFIAISIYLLLHLRHCIRCINTSLVFVPLDYFTSNYECAHALQIRNVARPHKLIIQCRQDSNRNKTF